MTTPILARDIMTKNLVTLKADLDVFAAIDILLRKRISGAPVVDQAGDFVGIFSEKSCMRVVLHAAYENMPSTGLLPFIVTDPPSIAPDTDLLSICSTFLDQATRRLPVLEGGKLIGQISRRDVMRHICELPRNKSQPSTLYLSALRGEQSAIPERLG